MSTKFASFAARKRPPNSKRVLSKIIYGHALGRLRGCVDVEAAQDGDVCDTKQRARTPVTQTEQITPALRT